MLRQETLTTISMLAPNLVTLRAMQRADRDLCLTPAQQFMVRTRYRQLEQVESYIWCALPNGKGDGISIALHNDGSIYCRYYCVNGVQHGTHCTYWLFRPGCKPDRLRRLRRYRHGAKFGVKQSWHENGQLSEEYQYVDGKKQGIYQSWYMSGQLSIRSTYDRNELHGSWISWYENNILHMRAEYELGVKHGAQQYWYSNGSPRELFTWAMGRLNGDRKRWDASGALVGYEIYDHNGNIKTGHMA